MMSILPKLARRAAGQIGHLRRVGRVGNGDFDGVALARELVAQLFQPLLPPGRRQNADAFAGQENRGFTADTARCADDQRGLVFQGNWHV